MSVFGAVLIVGIGLVGSAVLVWAVGRAEPATARDNYERAQQLRRTFELETCSYQLALSMAQLKALTGDASAADGLESVEASWRAAAIACMEAWLPLLEGKDQVRCAEMLLDVREHRAGPESVSLGFYR